MGKYKKETMIERGITLAQAYPDIANEWNYKLNKDTPWDISSKSAQKRWFTCSNNHNYEAKLDDRTRPQGCGYCAGKIVGQGNDLSTNYPELVKEWSKNNDKLPNKVTPGSDYRAEWICSKNHTWKTQVKNRANGTKCPKCCTSNTSQPEIKLAKILKGKQGIRIGSYKPDIVIGNTIIEYDGAYRHKDKYEHDIKKTNLYNKLGYTTIRIRVQEDRCPLKDIPNAINIHFDIKDEAKLNFDDLVAKIKEVMV